LYIEGLDTGTQNISCEYILEGETLYTETVKVSVLDVVPVANYDCDSDIDAEDLFRYSTNEVYRFWINDDNDDPNKEDGNDKDDIPGDGTADWEKEGMIGSRKYKIDGTRDLIDFFPVAILGLESTVNILPTSDYDYVLWQSTESLNIYKTPELSPGNVSKYLYDKTYCQARNRAELYHVENYDIKLNDFMDDLTDNSECVVLFEGREETTSPLILEIKRRSDGITMFSTILRLSISDIEDMYRYLNFRDGGTNITGERQKYPDSLCNDKNVFFVHGVNIEENLARGWNAEMFKRLHWAGSNAKFWGVTWHSDEGFDYNYHPNVNTAFETALTFANTVSNIQNKVIMAHSLGNILVSSAIEDHNMQVEKYFMLNAAVASEAFDSTMANMSANSSNYMLQDDWYGYLPRTWASQWYELFDLPDKRAMLSWQGRFSNVLNQDVYNFYSSGDHTLEIKETGNPTRMSGLLSFTVERYAWHKQEMFKGRGGFGGSLLAGWEICTGYDYYTSAEINSLSDSALRVSPVFLQQPTWLGSTNITVNNVTEMLAKGIPAISYPTGYTPITLEDFEKNIDMNATEFKPNGWVNRFSFGDRWKHEDLIDMAYLYDYMLFKKIVELGELK